MPQEFAPLLGGRLSDLTGAICASRFLRETMAKVVWTLTIAPIPWTMDLCRPEGRTIRDTDHPRFAVLSRVPGLRSVSLRNVHGPLADAALQSIASGCPRLRELNVASSSASGLALHAVASKCLQLESLNVDFVHWLTEDMLIRVVRAMPKLQRLHARNQIHVTDAFVAVATTGGSLRELDIGDCVKLSENSLRIIGANCPALETLYVGSGPLLGGTLKFVASGCPKLRKLCVRGYHSISDADLIAVARRCPGLEDLDVTNCANLTDASIVEVAARCSKLERLVVSGTNLTDVAVTHVARQCPRLAQFRAEWCRYLTGRAILEIAAHRP